MNLPFLLLFLLLVSFHPLSADEADAEATDNQAIDFDDTLLEEALVYPDWFILSSGDLSDDLKTATDENKKGLILYFGQKHCAYCEQFLHNNLGTSDIRQTIETNFDMIPIDIWGIEDLVDTDGETYTERELALKYEANFTPSVVFYDKEGEAIFRLRGYYPPYKFRAALQFVIEGFYKEESFRNYLARAEPGLFFAEEGLNERDFFTPSPYDLNRMDRPSKKPLAVFFERGTCHACDLLHTGPLNDERTINELEQMTVVQLNMATESPVTTPDGRKTTAKAWAEELGLFHAPTILFFNEVGLEVFRVDSIVQFYRIWGVLDYVNKRAYTKTKDYQAWRLQQRELKE